MSNREAKINVHNQNPCDAEQMSDAITCNFDFSTTLLYPYTNFKHKNVSETEAFSLLKALFLPSYRAAWL